MNQTRKPLQKLKQRDQERQLGRAITKWGAIEKEIIESYSID